MKPKTFALAAVCLSAPCADAATPVNWPQFRGGKAAGVADASTLPTQWSAKNNVTRLPLLI